MELKINERLEEIIPHLKEEDYIALRNSIKEKGLLKPIDIMKDGTIIDGHHRFKACRELRIEILTTILPNIKTIEEAIEYSLTTNLARRQLSIFEKVLWAKKTNFVALVTKQGVEGEGLEKASSILGIDRSTISQILTVINNSSEGLILYQIQNNDLGWKTVYDAIRSSEKIVTSKKKEELQNQFKTGELTLEEFTTEVKRVLKEETLSDEELEPEPKTNTPSCKISTNEEGPTCEENIKLGDIMTLADMLINDLNKLTKLPSEEYLKELKDLFMILMHIGIPDMCTAKPHSPRGVFSCACDYCKAHPTEALKERMIGHDREVNKHKRVSAKKV